MFVSAILLPILSEYTVISITSNSCDIKLLSADFTTAKTLHFPSKTVSLVPRAIFVNCCTFYVQVYYTPWSTGGDNELQYDKQIPTFVFPTVNQPCKGIPTFVIPTVNQPWKKNTNVCYLYCQPTMETNTNVSLQSIYHLNKYQRNLIVNQIYAGV